MNDIKTVCLDPGHGPGCVNGAPDRSYLEREFTWDLYVRLRPMLEAQGIRVVGTRSGPETMPSLTRRADISNDAHADLFISLHTNAAGNDGWYRAKGLVVYTSVPGEQAMRNKAAQCVVARAREAGIPIVSDGLKHELFTVLVKTRAPAILIEYGFHTNREEVALLKDGAYRDLLAIMTTKAVCDFLGITYTDSEPPSDRVRVQKRFALADSTMDYLEEYQYADELLHKLADGK